jgi:tRNA 2-thiouridine synthesizing protein A
MTNSSNSSLPPIASSPGSAELDLRGEICPFTFVRTKLALESMAAGERLRVIVDHPAARLNVPRSLEQWQQRVLGVVELTPSVWAIDVERC